MRATRELDPVDSSPAFGDGTLQRLHPLYVRAHLVGMRTFAAVLGVAGSIGIALAGLVGGEPLWFLALLAVAAALLVIAIFVFGSRWIHLSYAHTAYSVSAEGLEIRRGVIWRKIVDVPRSRIQHTDVTQGPLERAFGLASLVLYTAGVEHGKIELEGLGFETALALRVELLQAGACETGRDEQSIEAPRPPANASGIEGSDDPPVE